MSLHRLRASHVIASGVDSAAPWLTLCPTLCRYCILAIGRLRLL